MGWVIIVLPTLLEFLLFQGARRSNNLGDLAEKKPPAPTDGDPPGYPPQWTPTLRASGKSPKAWHKWNIFGTNELLYKPDGLGIAI